jgi:hypothetical protein
MMHPPSARISEYLDGDLPDGEAQKLEAHLAECHACAEILVELKKVQALARALPERLPSRDLWPEIAAALREGGVEGTDVIRLHPDWSAPAARRSRRFLRLSIPQAVAASLALMLGSGSVGAVLSRESVPDPGQEVAVGGDPAGVQGFPDAPPEVQRLVGEVARLEGSLALHREDLGPTAIRALEKNLEIMDQAIQESYAALRADPHSSFLEGHLARSVRTKAEYLREATLLVAPAT